ncbi:Hypothetical predicted protein [Marmota monax]|uniref:Protein kinase domain-containing protein n=1 Tax=Marmota monax TaxID=9995 RepID=A0A5E4BK74_MARMO|nr:Hypothetical predicted protein [Marmota monax]
MKNYKAIGKIGEGTFSEVMKMQSLRDGNYYACKQMKQHFERADSDGLRVGQLLNIHYTNKPKMDAIRKLSERGRVTTVAVKPEQFHSCLQLENEPSQPFIIFL